MASPRHAHTLAVSWFRTSRTEETCVILLIQDLNISVVNAITGELIRELVLNPHIDYQPTGAPKGPAKE